MASESKVIVGLSGGVDSSLSAWLLQQQGYLVEGFFMKNWEDDSAECPATQDLLDVMKICDHLNIHLHAENFSQDYADRVFKNFIEEYEQGRTPNPDILCNREIKFDVLLQKAQQLGADFFATGHYAKLTHPNTQNGSTTELHRAADENKDQSYFLYALSQKQLANTLFPLEDWHKPQVRKKARELGLITHNKKDSTGICFIGNKKFQTFFKDYTHTKKGEIIDPNNKVLGTHMGVAFYTIGQRKGLGIGGQKNGSQEPWYVCEKNVKTNQLRIAQGENHPLLNHHHLSAHQLNWINQPPCPTNKSITARIRHRQPLQPLQIIELSTTKDTLNVRFQAPQFAIAAGQSIVLYQGTQCLGGGIIKERW
jgi:tRNA-specific 2-thiouridylase